MKTNSSLPHTEWVDIYSIYSLAESPLRCWCSYHPHVSLYFTGPRSGIKYATLPWYICCEFVAILCYLMAIVIQQLQRFILILILIFLQRIFLVRTKNIFVSPPLPGPTLHPRMRSGGEIASWVVLNEYDFYLNVYNQVGQKLWIPFLWLSSWLNLINFGWKDFHWK